jgi:hypothetical protein
MIRNAVSHGIAAFNLAAEGCDLSALGHFVRLAAFLGEYGNWNM